MDALRRAGWTEEAIVDAVGIVGFFNFVTRVADGLGVELNKEYTLPGAMRFGEPGR